MKRRERERERERESEREGSPIEVSSNEIVDLLLSFGMKVLKLMHSAAR
jgi:hypothetical protein